MKNKMITAVLTVLVMCSGVLVAQKNTQKTFHSHKNSEKKLDKLISELDLTTEQASEISDIMEKSKQERAEIEKKYPELKEAKEEMKEIKSYHKEAYKKVLSKEQQSIMKEKHLMKHKGNEEERVAKLKQELNLTDQQAGELEAIENNVSSRKKAVKEKYPELGQAKKELKNLRTKTKKQVEAILSEEQLLKYKAMKSTKHAHKKGPKKM